MKIVSRAELELLREFGIALYAVRAHMPILAVAGHLLASL